MTLVLVGAAACAQTKTAPETVETLREKSPTLRGKSRLRILVEANAPLMSHVDPRTQKRVGFEIEIATMLAAELGFSEDKIDWIPIKSGPDRQTFLQSGLAEMTVASFSITKEREQFVNFAGPYMLVPQALITLRQRKKPLQNIADLRAPGVRVCTLTGSTSDKALIAKGISADPVDAPIQCIEALKAGKYDAFSTDLTILAGFLATDPQTLEIIDFAIADDSERLGIAVPKNDPALRSLIAYFLNKWRTGPAISSPWLRAFDHTIGPYIDPKYRSQPLVDDPPALADYDSKSPTS